MSKPLPRELIALTRTHELLAEAKTFDDFRVIRDKAEVARLYAKSAKLGVEVQIQAAELKLECERRAGQALREMTLSAGGRPSKANRSQVATSLEELGINKSQSSRWQDESSLPEDEYRRYVAECRAAGRQPSSRGLLLRARQFIECRTMQGPHRRAKNKRASELFVVDSRTVEPTPGFASADDQRTAIRELCLHHKKLTDHLANYCRDEPLVEPTPAQRLCIRNLLNEMGACLAILREGRR
jgi:hypothetical protein